LAYIMEILGLPEPPVLELSTRKHLFFDENSKAIIIPNSRGKERHPNTKQLERVLKCQDPKFLSFLRGCFKWHPVDRMTPLEALQHEWILEGLPDKVLQHHKKMFSVPEDKRTLKKATQSEIQGFPANAQSQSIYEIINEIRADDAERDKRK